MNPSQQQEWNARMAPVAERVPLQVVVSWWLDTWEWRTAEVNAGRGNAYDLHPSYRVPWSMATSKFPWLDVNDRIDIGPIMEAEMKRRSKNSPDMRQFYRDYMKEKRDFERPRGSKP